MVAERAIAAAILRCARCQVGLGYSHEFIGAAVIEEIVIALRRGSFHEHHVRNLPNLLPILLRRKYGIRTAHEQMTGILAVEDGEPSAVNEVIVGAVVHQDNPGWRQDGCGSGFNHSGVETSWTRRKNGPI